MSTPETTDEPQVTQEDCKIDTTLLKEAIRRMSRDGGISAPSKAGFCIHCYQNERAFHTNILKFLEAIEAHANAAFPPYYVGIYCAGSEPENQNKPD